MITITPKNFQEEAAAWLVNQASSIQTKQTITLKSPTGSGKTVILVEFIDNYLESDQDTAFVWLCPGKGALEEQSRKKMMFYAPDRKAQTLDDALISGFVAGSTTFINWEKITKKSNAALKDSEKKNLFERINDAGRNGVKFIVIIDEEHSNDTAKAKDIIDSFNARHIVRVSATTRKSDQMEFKEISEEDVIAEQLITKAIYVNQAIEDDSDEDEGADVLLVAADKKRKEIIAEYEKLGKIIRPLVLIQFPNGKPETIVMVEEQLEKMGYTHNNGMVATWMSEDKRDLDDAIIDNDGQQAFLLMKQAISTGWDCPRAKILVKLREGMSEQFTIQTIGRIRRMPEATHYDNDVLDCCYVYTFDQAYKKGLLSDVERAYEQRILHLKDKCKTFSLVKQNRNLDYAGLGEREILERLYNYFEAAYDLDKDFEDNKKKMSDAASYIFGDHIYAKFIQGKFATIKELEEGEFGERSTKVNTHAHGIYMLHSTNELKATLSLQQQQVRTILERLFWDGDRSKYKLLKLSRDEFYAFVINNEHNLKADCASMASGLIAQQVQQMSLFPVKTDDFKIPEEDYFKYDSTAKSETDYLSNAYEKYTSGFATHKVRSHSESMFERYCDIQADIDWVYKNGDAGLQYFSIVYLTTAGKQCLFYPDYIVKMNDGKVWLVEAKGGESKEGETENIDAYVEIKFEALKKYAAENNVNWGFVRNYDGRLFINNTEYHEEMSDDHWQPIEELFLNK